MIRYSKIMLVAAMSFYCFLVFFGNVTDVQTNYSSVVRALTMNDIFPQSTIAYRAITNPLVQHVAFAFIVSLEGLTSILCFLGAVYMFRARHEPGLVFNQAKNWSIGGLTLGFLTYQVVFMSIGGEWFGMWMSPVLNGAVSTAFQIFMTMIAVLIYVTAKDD